MRIVLTREAKADLEDVRSYLLPLNPQGSRRVIEAIKRAIDLIGENPRAGHRTAVADVLEFVEPRYGYRLPYWLKGGRVHILRVYHGARKPLDYERLRGDET